ncbi:MAG: oligosaccharide flippase family protein, partial [Verrucomicrobiota bacterium]
MRPIPEIPVQSTLTMGKSTYGQILKSSGLIGGSQAVVMLLGFVRTKVLAVLLGAQAPVAVGLVGIFTTLTQLINSTASLGASGSGVREISLAYASGDQRKFAVVLKALRRMLLVIGLAGGAFMLCAASWLSKVSFGGYDQTTAIRWLAVTVVLANISVTQGALLQGTRMIRQLAIVGTVTATVGTIGNIILYWKLGVNGVVPGLILISCVGPVAGWFYARRVPIMRIEQPLAETLRISKTLVTLGISFLTAGLMSLLVAWLIQTQISRQFGQSSLGHYTAAFRASGLIVGFILGAMATDFFPRLTAATGSNPEMVRLINEQTEVGVLMSMPALIGMLCFANWIIPLLYSKEFGPSIPMFCWLLLGCMGRVCSWPLGIVFAAQGASMQIVFVELTAAAIHLCAVGIGLHFLGPLGASIAFPTLYVVYG